MLDCDAHASCTCTRPSPEKMVGSVVIVPSLGVLYVPCCQITTACTQCGFVALLTQVTAIPDQLRVRSSGRRTYTVTAQSNPCL